MPINLPPEILYETLNMHGIHREKRKKVLRFNGVQKKIAEFIAVKESEPHKEEPAAILFLLPSRHSTPILTLFFFSPSYTTK